MRTLERLALAAIIAGLAGPDARTEEGRSLAEAGAGNVDPTGSQAQIAPDPSRSPLGRWHVWVKFAQTHFQDDAVADWGVDRATHIGLEFYCAAGRIYHVGGEIGSTSAGDLITSDGELIRDFRFFSFEGNNKWVFDLQHGITAEVGFGGAVFWVEGDEVTYWDGEESSSPLASFGFGLQFFGDLTWRVHRFLIGVDVKYQTAADWLYVDHSNVRFGAHLGVAF
jgi:hypothetical protein